MLPVSRRIQIPDDELEIRFVRSGGPGGQNVNKLATKAELRFHLEASAAVPADVKERFRDAFPGYLTQEGDVIITSSRYRTQARNREDAERKLVEMLQSVLQPPKRRKPTRVSKAAKQARVREKKRRAEVKRTRKPPRRED